ncbi:MAG: malonyl-CoA decarboxylase [Acidobacteriota bacterium]|nr:malonyl-CoA decarboxylase [Acidobacteriota bacterium]
MTGEPRTRFLDGLLGLFGRAPRVRARELPNLADALLSGRGEASGIALAHQLLTTYSGLDLEEKQWFLDVLAERFGVEPARVDRAIEEYRRDPGPRTAAGLHRAAEPRRQELIRRLNAAPGGTLALIRMREDVLQEATELEAMRAVDADFVHLFSSWFNSGFLVLERIDWSTPARILQKIIQYEAVHAITSWEDLQRRLDPSDRRCFAFFHPRLSGEPLIFVEVALTSAIPEAIAPLLSDSRAPADVERATTAVFYSISNCQPGLRGVSLGNFLIKQVIDELRRELPALRTFVTLSPVPGFAAWLRRERNSPDSARLNPTDRALLDTVDEAGWPQRSSARSALKPVLLAALADYLVHARNSAGKPIDPVARLHLNNGARLERIDWLADLSPKGLAQGLGFMVNYLYDPARIVENHERFAGKGEVVMSPSVRKLLLPGPSLPSEPSLPDPEPAARSGGRAS